MSDRGHAAVEFALAVGVLLLPVALVVISFGPWLERRVVARAAAAEASRATVLELDHAAGAEVARGIAAAHGLEMELVRLGWCGSPPSQIESPSGSCSLARGSVVEASVEILVPLLNTPWGEVGGLWAGASHAEPVDLYRSLP